MAGKKRVWDDDDGRTIADMSDVAGPSMFRPRQSDRKEPAMPEQPRRPWEETPMRGRERWMFVFGALKAALLIALAFLGGLAIVIFLLIQVWK